MDAHPPPRTVNAFFEPAAAVAACKAEDIMTMSADRLAEVAWPLLSDAERTLSMRDVFFTPPMRVSASPRATETAFAAGVQSCLAELTENLAHVQYGETPLSIARLRAAALAYQISAISKWSFKRAQQPAPANPALSSPLPRDRGVIGSEVARTGEDKERETNGLFDFALPSFVLPSGVRQIEETTASSRAATATTEASAAHGNGASVNNSVPLTTAIRSSSCNLPPDTTVTEPHTVNGGGEPKAEQNSGDDRYHNRAPHQSHDATDRETYERKSRSFVSDFVNVQWQSVVASTVHSDDAENTTTTTHPAATLTATKVPAISSTAAMLRRKIVRTALVLCHHAPTSAAAGHSFVCLLRHALRAVAATDDIRGPDSSSGPRAHPSHDGENATARSNTVKKPGKKGQTTTRSQASTTELSTVASTAPQSVLSLQASFWVEVVLALLHCVPLVQWTDDVLTEIGQVLETVPTTAPPKLVAVAQHQRQQRPTASATATMTSSTMTTGRHAESRRAARCCAKKRPFTASTAGAGDNVGAGVTVGVGAEHVVDFNVCIPFKIGLPKPAATQAKILNALSYGADEAPASTSAADQQQQPHSLLQQQHSLTSASATSANGNNDSSYPSSAFHEVSDIRDEEGEEDVTEELSAVDEEGQDEEPYTATSGGNSRAVPYSTSSSSSAQTPRASALNVPAHGSSSNDDEGGASQTTFGVLFGVPCGDFEAQPCRRRRVQMVEFSFPVATRVSVRLLESVDWEHQNPCGRDVLLLPLESTSSSAEKSTAATTSTGAAATAALSAAPDGFSNATAVAKATTSGEGNASSAIKVRCAGPDTLPLSLQSTRSDRSEALTHNGPCRVAIPSLAQKAVHMVPGEISAHLQLNLDTRWSTEWTVALSTAQRSVAEHLLSLIETKVHVVAGDDAQQQRRSRVASCVLLRGGLKASASGSVAATTVTEARTSAAAAGNALAVPSASVSVVATAASSPTGAAVADLDPFLAALLDMPLAVLRARVRCHTAHAEGVRATLAIIAHVFLQDRHGYLHGDQLTWHTAAWSEAVRRVSLASNVVGSAAVSGEAAMEVALFFARCVAGGCAASNTSRAQVIDAAIDLMSIDGLSLADVKAALDDRRQVSSAMWMVVDLLTKCSAVSRAPRHIALVAQAVRRLLLLGCATTQTTARNVSLPSLQQQQLHVPHPPIVAADALPTGASASASSAAAAERVAAVGRIPANHYLSVVNSCGRATEINLRRGVHALLTQLFRLLKALLYRIQSSQAAPHRFLLESWDYGVFAVFMVSLMVAPMDAEDMQLFAPFFADVATGLLPSFTRLSRTESLLLTSESEEHNFLVEVAKHVRGLASSSSLAGDGSGGDFGEAETPASREPHVVRKVEEVSTFASTASANGGSVGVWDVLQGGTAASWTPGHVRVEIWNGSCSGFYVGLASADLPTDVCGSERDPHGIYFMGDGTLQYGDVVRKQRRLPRWHAGDVVELSFIFAKGNWDVVMALNGLSMVRLTLPRRDFRLVAVNVRSGEYVPGDNHVHVLTVSPVYWKNCAAAPNKRVNHAGATTSSLPPSWPATSATVAVVSHTPTAAPADVRLSPFSRLTIFNISLFLELVLHYLVLHSSRQHYPSLASSIAATGICGTMSTSGTHGSHAHPPSTRVQPRRSGSSTLLIAATATHTSDGAAVTPPTLGNGSNSVHFAQICTAPLQHSLQQLVRLLHDLSHPGNKKSNTKGEGNTEAGAYDVKRTAAQHISNAMLLDLVVTLSISLPSSSVSLAMTVDMLTTVVECEAVARRTRTVALSALYNAITQHMFSEAISPVHAGMVRRLWTACYRLASEKPVYQPRFSPASVSAGSVIVYAGGRRIEHRRVSVSTTLSGNVRSVSYACIPIDLDDREIPEVVRVSVRLQRGFQCETLGRYYYFGLADIAPTPASTPVAQGNANASATSISNAEASAATTVKGTAAEELSRHPGDRVKQRRAYYISDYLSEVPDAAVQKADVDREKNYLNPESHIIFGSGDVVTAVVYVRERCIGFERNGFPLNVLYRDIPSSVRRLYPFVELYNRDSRAKWMYPPDEAAMSARYTMRAMLLSWPNAVLPLVKECLPRFGARARDAADSQSPSASLTRSFADSANDKDSGASSNDFIAKVTDSVDACDVVLGVLGADGDEMRMVYVAPPQLDQPGGRAQSVRVERFEHGMAVVSDEAGSLQHVCAAALEPDTTQEVNVAPASALRAAVQACLPELAVLATQCLQELRAPENNSNGDDEESKKDASATPARQVSLHRPATLLRVLRLVFTLIEPSTATTATAADKSGDATPQASALLPGPVSATPVLSEPTERAILTLLPLLEALLPVAQIDLPPSVLLREAWNELWCNPHLRWQVEITVPRYVTNNLATTSSSSSTTTKDAKSSLGKTEATQQQQQREQGNSESTGGSPSTNEEEIVYTCTEPAGITYSSSAQRFDDRLRAYRVDGNQYLCPSCGKRWSACTAYHTAPSSWCDLLDRVLRLLQQRQGKPAKGKMMSPYCGWFTEWTDGPLDVPGGKTAREGLPNAAAHHSIDCNNEDVRHHQQAASTSSPAAAGDDDRSYHSPTSAQSSDAQLWEDADDTSVETADGEGEEGDRAAESPPSPSNGEDANEASPATGRTVAGEAGDTSTAAGAERERPTPIKEEGTPMTLVVRRAAKPSPADDPSSNSNDDDEDDTVYVEGSGETRQCSFTFTGSLISPTLLRGQMIFDHVDLADAVNEAAANQEWACPLCTFLNQPEAVRCAICANARPGASWACPVCSYAYNALASATCVTCGCMRPSSVRRLHDAAGPIGYCTKCHQREHFRNFHAMRYRRYCASCGTVTRWLPKDKYSTTVEARLVGDGGMVEFQWALDGYNTVCFGLRTRAYNADMLWSLVDAAAQRCGSSALKEVGCYLPPIPERPLSTPSSRPLAAAASTTAASAGVAAAAAPPCMVGAIVYYASALVLRYARLLPVEQLADPGFLSRLHVCSPEWLDSWAQFPSQTVTPIFVQCLKLLQEGVRQPELVSTIATVALTLIRQQPRALGAEKHALLYALCLNVVRYGDTAQRKASYSCISALMEDDPAAALNVQPLVPVLSMEPLLEGQQRATVLALLHHASMNVTPVIAKACACMARTVEAMEHQRPLPPMLGKPFPYLVALTETRLSEGGELLVGQVRGSVGVAPNKGGKYYYEVEVPHDFISDRSKTIVMGWGTLEHERIASAQHVGSDLHSWGFNCREHLRLMLTEQALPVPQRPNQGDVIGSMMNLETMMVCWTINGQEISWVSVPAQGGGEEIFPYVSAAVEPQSVRIRLGNTRFKPAGYQDYTPPSDRDLWAQEESDYNSSTATTGGCNERASEPTADTIAATAAVVKKRVPQLTKPTQQPQSYEFYQQLSLALEEASITTLDDTSILSLLDTTKARSVLRQYPKLLELMNSTQQHTHQGNSCEETAGHTMYSESDMVTEDVQLLIPYIQWLRRAQELTTVVARHLPLIEKSPYLMSCYKKATDLLFSSGRWTIFELQPGGRPKYSGGHAFRVLVSVRKARHVRKEADAEWLSKHPGLVQQQHQHVASPAVAFGAQLMGDGSFDSPYTERHSLPEAASYGGDENDQRSNSNNRNNADTLSAQHAAVDSSDSSNNEGRAAASGTEDGEEDEEEEYVDVESDEDAEDVGSLTGGLTHSTSLAELRNALQAAYGDGSQFTPAERRLRCSITGQLFTQLEKTRIYQRARMFAVQLEGTLAVDAGGVTRAVMSMVGEELTYRFIRGVRVDPLLPLFQLCGHSTIFTVVPNMSALYASEAADGGAEGGLLRRMFEWLGKLIGNVVLCGTLKVPFDFPRLLWKTLTFQEDTITLADYAYDIDDNITAALEDDEFVLSDDFFAALPEHVRASQVFRRTLQSGSGSGDSVHNGGDSNATGHYAAMPSTCPLRPYVCMTPAMSMQDMSHLALEEMEEYVADAEVAELSRRRALAQEALLHQYDPAFLAIRAGLTSVVPASSLRAVRWEDLRARVCGNGAASTEHVLAELDMSPLPPSMRAMLTQVLSSFTESQLSRFLLFCSGQSRIPLPEKVLVNCGDDAGRLPTAHTCSPISLLLQPCSSAAELQNNLEVCLTHASEFGFV